MFARSAESGVFMDTRVPRLRASYKYYIAELWREHFALGQDLADVLARRPVGK